jgi:hypothetical protein
MRAILSSDNLMDALRAMPRLVWQARAGGQAGQGAGKENREAEAQGRLTIRLE